MKTLAWNQWLCAVLVVVSLGGANPALAQVEAPLTPPTSVKEAPATQGARESFNSAWSHLFTSTLEDLRRLPSRDALTWLTVGGLSAAAVRPADAGMTRALSGSDSLHEALQAGAILGGARLQFGAAVATFALGRMANSPGTASVGADLFRAQVLAQTTTLAFKVSFRRARPDDTRFSFPSGHTSTAFASATVLQRRFGWKVGVPAYGLASYVAASRIQTKRHYLSDVVFGAALGITAGRTVTVGRGAARFGVAPMGTPGGGGVALTWIGNR